MSYLVKTYQKMGKQNSCYKIYIKIYYKLHNLLFDVCLSYEQKIIFSQKQELFQYYF